MLRFLVLDEGSYLRGSASERVALLVRKSPTTPRARAGASSLHRTSAILAKGTDAEKNILRFASDLFGTPFTRVIRGTAANTTC